MTKNNTATYRGEANIDDLMNLCDLFLYLYRQLAMSAFDCTIQYSTVNQTETANYEAAFNMLILVNSIAIWLRTQTTICS